MKKHVLTSIFLMIAVCVISAGPGTVRACDDMEQKGIMLGHTDSQEFVWTFSLINLTSSNVYIGIDNSDHSFGGDFPYGTTYPPGNSVVKNNGNPIANNGDTSKIGLTTWKSDQHNKMFPDHCVTTVPVEIHDNTNANNFSLHFEQNLNETAQKSVIVRFSPAVTTNTWNFKTAVSNDNGFYAFEPRSKGDRHYSDGKPMHDSEAGYEGILYAINDRYVLSLYKNNDFHNGGNSLILVITERFKNLDYHGNKNQWVF
jgi:hypothetical protein